MAILPFAAGLAHKFAFHVRHFLAQGFAVSDLRTANVGLDAKLALHPVDNDLQMQLTHAGDNRLAGLFIGMQTERRIFRRQPLQRDAHFLWSALVFGSMASEITGSETPSVRG